MPFTAITAFYVGILCVVIPLRCVLNGRRHRSVSHVNRLYAAIVAIHMILCLCWIIYAIDMLKYSTDACWDRVTWQYINYYAVLLLTMGPACTLALATALCILCLPCLLQSLYKTMRDKRQREDLTEKVVNGLA